MLGLSVELFVNKKRETHIVRGGRSYTRMRRRTTLGLTKFRDQGFRVLDYVAQSTWLKTSILRIMY